jgi:homoserine dehydrogenase-like protein
MWVFVSERPLTLDVARKLLILLREAGMAAELEDISIEAIFPATFDSSGSLDRFRAHLPHIDPWFAARVLALQAGNKALCFVGEIRNGRSRVGLLAVDASYPLYPIRDGDNALAFYTQRYDPVPLVIRGYSAGADVTAGVAYLLISCARYPSIQPGGIRECAKPGQDRLCWLSHKLVGKRADKYALLRRVRARRQPFFHGIQACMRSMVFDHGAHLMDFMLRGLALESQCDTSCSPK